MTAVQPAGRPRDPAIDDAILQATRDLLIESGYPRLSFDSVARRAGVTRPTIYRRWPSKMHLVHEAVFPVRQPARLPSSGDFAADLRTIIRRQFDAYARPEVSAAMPGLIADLHGDPVMRSNVIDRLETPVREQFAALVERGRAEGVLARSVDADTVFDTIAGALFHRVAIQLRTDDRFVDELTKLLLDGARQHS